MIGKTSILKTCCFILFGNFFLFLSGGLLSEAFGRGLGMAEDWQLGLQAPANSMMEWVIWFHDDFLLLIISAIALFVFVLMAYVLFRFNGRSHPTPRKTTHNTTIEVVWTIVPVLILLTIAIPSLRLLYSQVNPPSDISMTIKATGNQWYWSYDYPDHGDINFDSIMLDGESLAARRVLDPLAPRLLAVDNELILPADTSIRILITANDVLHNFAVPSLGVRMDAVPGRLNETWIPPTRAGVYYGQCSELCGINHAYMPITVRVVPVSVFERWVLAAQEDVDSAQQDLLSSLPGISDSRFNVSDILQSQ